VKKVTWKDKSTGEVGQTFLDAAAALEMCNKPIWANLQVTKPVHILEAFFRAASEVIPTQDALKYVSPGAAPCYLFYAGPAGAGKTFGSSRLLAAAFENEPALNEVPLIIELDTQLLGGLVVVGGKHHGPKDACGDFVTSCEVTFSTGTRGNPQTFDPVVSYRQIVTSPSPFKGILLLVLASQQTVGCNMYYRKAIEHKPPIANEWDDGMESVRMLLRMVPDSHTSAVWVWFNEIAGICDSKTQPAVAGTTNLATLPQIKHFCESNAVALKAKGSMYRHYVSPAVPAQMRSQDVMDILETRDGKVDYLHNLKTTLESLKMASLQSTVFPTPVCPSQSSTLMNFQGAAEETQPPPTFKEQQTQGAAEETLTASYESAVFIPAMWASLSFGLGALVWCVHLGRQRAQNTGDLYAILVE